ncbi:hypothetical protein, variant 1 [Aphanomyces astaci]|uniref:Uncharacterized protein n=1 Tax=Aphanomyces astaci TaxID=112090 RepID=W4GXZ7_APHAT|nr:hypothetical protein, variant 1 [Aphanomyces astaci]ETV83899.1 hypothetical protein, variant 1 [Aphanomyces astaci]|eukprot:XP_009827330.1 hypothetical protein, variant 1 [Aphanomyces astaci]
MFFRTDPSNWTRYEEEAKASRKRFLAKLKRHEVHVDNPSIEIVRLPKAVFNMDLMEYAQKPGGLPRDVVVFDMFDVDVTCASITDGILWSTRSDDDVVAPCLAANVDDIVETQPMGKIDSPFELEIESTIDVQGMSMPIYDDVTLAGSDEAISIACNWYEELNRRAALEDSVETPLDTIPVKISQHEPSIVAQDVAFDKVDVLDPFDHHTAAVGIAFHPTLLDGCVELTGIDWEHSRQSILFLFDDMSCPDPRTYLDVLVPAASPPAHMTKPLVEIEPLDVGSNMPSCRTSTSLDEMHATMYKSTLLDGHLVRPTPKAFSVSIFDHTSACSNLQDALFPQPTSTCNVRIQQLLLPPSAHVHRSHDEIAFIESFKAFTRDILAVSHTPALQRISPSTLAIDMPTFWLTASSNFKDILFPDNEEVNEGAIVPHHCNAGGELQPTPHLIAPEEHSVEKSNKRHKPEEPAHRRRKRLRTRSTTIEHSTANTTSNGHAEDSSLSQSISHAARPLIWSLSSKKVLQIQETPLKSALQHLSIGSLRSKVQAKYLDLKRIIHTSTTINEKTQRAEIIRDLFYVHTLRLMLLVLDEHGTDACVAFVHTCVTRSKVERVLGPAYIFRLRHLVHQQEEDEPIVVTPETKFNTNIINQSGPWPILSSVDFPLSDDVAALALRQGDCINVFLRELDPPLSLIVGLQTGICVVEKSIFLDDAQTKEFAYQIAQIQHQFAKIWVVLENYPPGYAKETDKLEQCYLAFSTAAMGLSIPVVSMISNSPLDSAAYIQQIIRQPNNTVPEDLTFPEDESQLERLVASTKAMNPYCAQYLMDRISLADFFQLPWDRLDLSRVPGIPEHQLRCLYRFDLVFLICCD